MAAPLRSLDMVVSPRWWRGLAILIVVLFGITGVVLAFLPWQQSVRASGYVVLVTPGASPQLIKPDEMEKLPPAPLEELKEREEQILRHKEEVRSWRKEARERAEILQKLFAESATTVSRAGKTAAAGEDVVRMAQLASAIAETRESMIRGDIELLRLDEKLEEIVAREKKRRLPASAQPGAQLTVSDSDALLIDPGHLVRLRFTGWPGLYSATAAARGPGLFSGVVAAIEPALGEPGRFHLLVRPAKERIRAGLDPPWPPAERLRPGTRVSGTVLLNRVPLWHELWRRFNVSPPVGKKGQKIKAPETEKTGVSKP